MLGIELFLTIFFLFFLIPLAPRIPADPSGSCTLQQANFNKAGLLATECCGPLLSCLGMRTSRHRS